MAETSPSVHQRDLYNIKRLLWSTDIKSDIFRRWSQGFYFSTSEPTALEQAEGGPCAIIAPVQAFILKNLLLKYKDLSFREMAVTSDMQTHLLANALCEILEQCTGQKYFLVYLSDTSDEVVQNGVVSESESTVFHEGLRIHVFQNVEEVRKYYIENINHLKSQYGILLFLYSVILTRGLEEVQSDNSNDTSEPLIDDTYGYGSQSLINLMITGRATTYVWDHEQDVGGLKLKGLEKQSQIGFITIMEHLRYCTVGSFYKNPIHPVWVLGSDTHLTVLFSTERRLVSPETKTDQAKRVFKHFDPDGNNFISSSLLQDVLQALDLVSEEEYVEVMRKKLDPENLGIILLNNFMDEFFPKEDNPMPDVFALVHYNSLAQSNLDGQIRYRIGECVLLESDLRAVSESNPMLTVLQTKWPNIEVRWNELGTPSLN
ncbi:ubiquitin carboxyl-terminal hydrolase MINDY-3 homolog isoform X1 [Tribolium madens]|uniref:ubiquitin carboxyl-terminal hydrolase MINDY-3 homolog isoform X1 n=1 Tax=Tribolium madens TaxID=41895 RepID=UPI001CF74D59|nr:ubiquitin carboxyl-terminal hydrolase MINDY-3 homolog isoform X1 [Tribolium madens]